MSDTVSEPIAPNQVRAREENHFDLVVVGHVDHGKSTLIGRLLADTGSLPEGKLEQVRAQCARTSRPFEYAFLLDALKAEQSQGITIDTARCFFRTARRRYIINDAPGHIEFLKNMVTGAARAEAALLLIDAAEGIQENSRRHGYIMSMLGIRQVVVVVNKMDLVDYSQEVFKSIENEYRIFLDRLGVHPLRFIPVSAREGENIAKQSEATPWYEGPTVLGQIDQFERPDAAIGLPFRLPVQDIYKFTQEGDDRRIIAGTVETGTIGVGDPVVFLPSRKRSRIASIEVFNAPGPAHAGAGQVAGYTLSEQVYIKPGELMVRAEEPQARVATRFRANIFWMGRSPMVQGRRYKLKIGSARVPLELTSVISVLDASELRSIAGKGQVDCHDVAEVVLEATRPVAFDLSGEIEQTSRFVIVDGDNIAACGIVLEELQAGASLLERRVDLREESWERGLVDARQRAARYGHSGKFIVFIGENFDQTRDLAHHLELSLHTKGRHTYYLGIRSMLEELVARSTHQVMERENQLIRLGEMARVMTEAGTLFITALPEADEHDIDTLRSLNAPYELFVVTVGEAALRPDLVQVSLADPSDPDRAVDILSAALADHGIVLDYQI